MLNNLKLWLSAAALATAGLAAALPALPAATTIGSAVQQAVSAPASQNAQQASAQPVLDQTIAQARTGRSVVAHATAYNSLGGQTDSTPNITATGTRTRVGVVALSRDLLRVFPYGTRVRIDDLSGRSNLSGQVFVVEDTMNARISNTVDVWMPTYRQAIAFGSRTVRITALR